MTEPIVPTKRRERVWPWVVGAVLVIAVIAAFLVPVPYYLEGPGSTRNTVSLIHISGHDSYDSAGQLRYTTVSQRRATVASLIGSRFSDGVEVVPKDEAVPSGDRKTERLIDQARMDRSKLIALMVAFDILGLPLTVHGEGALINGFADGAPSADILAAADVITAVNGSPVETSSDLRGLLDGFAVGDTVTLTVSRLDSGEPTDLLVPDAPRTQLDLQVPLMKNPNADSEGADPNRPVLGITVSTYNETVDTGFDIELDSGSVLGPSAGLAWALGIIDRLSPTDLTDGRVIAMTGEITAAGDVRPIGGIEKKVIGAIRDGAVLFLYPADTVDEDVDAMRKAADGRIEMVPVSTVREALDVLAPNGIEPADPS